MRFKYDMEFHPFGEYFLAVPVGDVCRGKVDYMRINSSCHHIARLIEAGKTQDEIIDAYASRYGIERSLAERDVTCIFDAFLKIGFCEE